ncbi:MAG: T9SS type A sorting domain-containing protein [Candidatus Krumholzibacteriota bacterium]|nr:T9SS type A sorting domain-containing protein [Candidatus Krumholzibacteriota bacterium]
MYYSVGDPGYLFHELDIGTMVGNDPIQVALGVADLCWYWYPAQGNCAVHTPAPWFDNVSVVRYETPGPQWSYNEWDLFQDNFPGVEYNLESWVRADRAEDVSLTPAIVPGDYIEVTCASPTGGGIDTTGDGRPLVYMYVRCRNIGPDAKPDLVGPDLAGDYCSFCTVPAVPPWTPLQADRAWPDDTYRFDLNDSLFTRGYMIDYYFRAYDQYGRTSVLPAGADTGTPNPAGVRPYFEFTCLPTLGSDILYVDDYDGVGIRGGTVQYYHDDSYRAVLDPMDLPDRYDVNAPTAMVSNGLASRARLMHLLEAYETIIWDSGDLAEGTITDGLRLDKTDDCSMLDDWLELSDHDVNLWICGDNIASDLAAFPSPQSMRLMFTSCGVNVRACSFYQFSGGFGGGGIAIPRVDGFPLSSPFSGDIFYAFGGCPAVNHFDVLDTLSGGVPALRYEPFDEGTYFAGVRHEYLNSQSRNAQTMWFGFSLMFIRDFVLHQPQIRNTVMKQAFDWFGTVTQADVTEADRPPVDYSLSRNYPNPFNPSTTVSFSLRERGPVRIGIYDVAGRLVCTLVDEVRDAGRYTERWDGRNDRGTAATSGIYFCRMESGGWFASRKLVLLR